MRLFDINRYSTALGLGLLTTVGGAPSIALCGDDLGIVATSQYNEMLGAGGLRFDLVQKQKSLPLLRAFGHVIEARDMNNDGIVDLLIGFEDLDSRVQYALGELQADGSIGFVLHSYRTLGQYETATACDIDGNGSADFVVRDEGSTAIWVHYIENDEIVNIHFLSHFNMLYSNDSPNGYIDARTTVRGGDLDGDGLADLVMNTVHDKVVVRWSSRPEEDAFESLSVPQLDTHNVLYPLRDYDGDSLLDVLLLDLESERFLLLSGTGSDSLMIPHDLQVPASGHVGELAYPVFGQFDINPALDMVLYDSVQGWVVVPNFALGFDPLVPLTLAGDDRVVSVPGDVDLSGFDDLLVVGEDPLSNSPGEIEEVSLVIDPLSVGTTIIKMETGNTPDAELLVDSGRPRLPRCLAINLDADPENELLWLNDLTEHKIQDEFTGGSVRGWMIRASEDRATSDGLPQFGASQFEGQKRPLHMLPIDLDQDGVDELYMVGGGRGRIVDIDEGTVANVLGVNDGFMSVAADLGGDGFPEIIVARVQSSLIVVPIHGDGTVGKRALFPNPNGNDYGGVVSADFDGDGKDDLAAVDLTANEVHIWSGTGDAQMVISDMFGIDALSNTVRPGILDINADGYLDLVIGELGGFVSHINQQDGTFEQGETLQDPIDPYWIITEDMDRDGIVDIVSVDRNLGNIGDGISVHFMNADGGVESVRYLFYLSDSPVSEVIAADFNGDGLPDLVGSIGPPPFGGSASGNKHIVWAQVAGRDFEAHAVLPASASATVEMSDFNQDGAMDVVTASDRDDSVRVHWGTPAGCLADLNGDGTLDFFDISAFLSTLPDFNGDGAFDFFDVSAFLSAFATGCP